MPPHRVNFQGSFRDPRRDHEASRSKPHVVWEIQCLHSCNLQSPEKNKLVDEALYWMHLRVVIKQSCTFATSLISIRKNAGRFSGIAHSSVIARQVLLTWNVVGFFKKYFTLNNTSRIAPMDPVRKPKIFHRISLGRLFREKKVRSNSCSTELLSSSEREFIWTEHIGTKRRKKKINLHRDNGSVARFSRTHTHTLCTHNSKLHKGRTRPGPGLSSLI